MAVRTGAVVAILALVAVGMGVGAPAAAGGAQREQHPEPPLPPANPLADNALRPRIIPPTPSAYEAMPKESLTAWVAKVNGDAIVRGFFTRRVAANRAAAYRHFADKTGATPGAEFWTTDYGGETPVKWLTQRALDECMRIQVELGLAKRHGIVPDTSYAAFLKALDRENERRRAALARGEPIYGPQQYREDDFLVYVMNNLRLALQRQLAGNELKASEAALREYYQSVKEQHFDRGYRVKVWAIEVIAGAREGYAKSYTPEEARARIEEAKRKLEAGERFEAVAATYNENGELHERVFDFESRSADKMQAAMRDEAMRLEEGQTSGIFQEMNALYVLKCIEKEPLGYRTFAEAQDLVTRMHLRQSYERLVDRLVKSATIKMNRAELDRVEVR